MCVVKQQAQEKPNKSDEQDYSTKTFSDQLIYQYLHPTKCMP